MEKRARRGGLPVKKQEAGGTQKKRGKINCALFMHTKRKRRQFVLDGM